MNKRERIESLIDSGKNVAQNHRASVRRASASGVADLRGVGTWVEGFDKWVADVGIALGRYFYDHPLKAKLDKALVDKKFTEIMGTLEAIQGDDEYFEFTDTISIPQNIELISIDHIYNNDVFIVHGHDDEAIAKTENFVRKMGLNPIILRNQASMGRTIIEKVEMYTDVGFAIVLYTPCDEMKDGQFRARQNVVIEHGYLMGKLGRERVASLVKGTVETPGDIDGVVYIPMDNGKAWEHDLAKELRAAGYDANANKI